MPRPTALRTAAWSSDEGLHPRGEVLGAGAGDESVALGVELLGKAVAEGGAQQVLDAAIGQRRPCGEALRQAVGLGLSSAAGTTLLTSPSRSASAASTGSDRSAISMALRKPTTRGRRRWRRRPATMPIRV